MRQAKEQVDNYLRLRHGIQQDEDGRYMDDYNLLTRQDVLGAQLASAYTFSLLLSAMAVVSLIVGGIGIMNVMLVSHRADARDRGAGGGAQRHRAQHLMEAKDQPGRRLVGVLSGMHPLAARLNQG
jgi:hypothetical protein